MDGSPARLLGPVLDRVPPIRKAPRPTGTTAADGQLSAGWSLVLGLGWPLAFMIATAVEPAPADPEASAPLLVELVGLALLMPMYATIVAAVTRHPLAAAGGVVTGVILAAFSVMCPVSGHHGFGLWWFAQIGVILAMLVASVAALSRRADRATSS